MKKQVLTVFMAGILTASMSMTALAGWEQEGNNWKYNDNGAYAANGWYWIDGNNDGIAESYYFDNTGILARDTTVEGYTVNADGAWTVNGEIQTQNVAVNNGGAATGGVNHNAGYDPAHPLAGKIDEWNLRISNTGLIGASGIPICDDNVQALLTNQMDKYYIAPVGNSINPETGTQMYVSQEDYDKGVMLENALYQWFCNWLNGMDFENMSEMDRAREIQKVLGQGVYEGMGSLERNGYYSVLIDKKGLCAEYAVTACSLAKALGLKSAISGTGDHMVYYIQVDGIAYMGSNQVLNLDFPTPDYVPFGN
ncbi:hypothetical protein D7X87_07495 [bacterium D16-54]|nr:hypothetical protein D7X87_07495 [bacterium D16-54]RKJ15371.1 hypothetical protein D7X65_08155 [bacterium D16-56]